MEEIVDQHWVFGYGSLMWRPGFPFKERQTATLYGRRRAFCMYSVYHRGTVERPGLTLGLAQGGSVRGTAFLVAERDWADTYAYLCKRELPTAAYREAFAEIRLSDGRKVRSLVYLPDTSHPQWAGMLPLERQCELVLEASGVSGKNQDYLRDLVACLKAAGIPAHNLEALLKMVQMRSNLLASA